MTAQQAIGAAGLSRGDADLLHADIRAVPHNAYADAHGRLLLLVANPVVRVGRNQWTIPVSIFYMLSTDLAKISLLFFYLQLSLDLNIFACRPIYASWDLAAMHTAAGIVAAIYNCVLTIKLFSSDDYTCTRAPAPARPGGRGGGPRAAIKSKRNHGKQGGAIKLESGGGSSESGRKTMGGDDEVKLWTRPDFWDEPGRIVQVSAKGHNRPKRPFPDRNHPNWDDGDSPWG
ncbi:hypothetical protein DL771_006784 [Monosporascus sp. 5C6A]|nr:hypothetical protein DL771_006784 [Monosporascus sp. 5C6A]